MVYKNLVDGYFLHEIDNKYKYANRMKTFVRI